MIHPVFILLEYTFRDRRLCDFSTLSYFQWFINCLSFWPSIYFILATIWWLFWITMWLRTHKVVRYIFDDIVKSGKPKMSVRFGIGIRFSIHVSFRVRRSVHTHQCYSDEPSVFLVSFLYFGCQNTCLQLFRSTWKIVFAAGVRQFDHLKHFHRYCRKICWSCVTWHADSDLCGE